MFYKFAVIYWILLFWWGLREWLCPVCCQGSCLKHADTAPPLSHPLRINPFKLLITSTSSLQLHTVVVCVQVFIASPPPGLGVAMHRSGGWSPVRNHLASLTFWNLPLMCERRDNSELDCRFVSPSWIPHKGLSMNSQLWKSALWGSVTFQTMWVTHQNVNFRREPELKMCGRLQAEG